MTVLFAGYLAKFRNPVKKIREHKELRGMSWSVDIRDWLGGYPYEYASVKEITDFVSGLGFSLKMVKPYIGLGNNEFVFERK
jgi:2-polyprenyl-6-hydroxyphenyl methylase/3-demethylubiquinone-9 3-methyltransferase